MSLHPEAKEILIDHINDLKTQEKLLKEVDYEKLDFELHSQIDDERESIENKILAMNSILIFILEPEE